MKDWVASATTTEHCGADVSARLKGEIVRLCVISSGQEFGVSTGLALAAWLIQAYAESRGIPYKDVSIKIDHGNPTGSPLLRR